MRIVLATHGFSGIGGSETYVFTVAEHLERLGHDVTVFALQGGEMSEHARETGLRVRIGAGELPSFPDVVLVQDAALAYMLAKRWPSTPQVFRACAESYDLQQPPQLPGIVARVLVTTGRMARHVRALAVHAPIVELRQPIDVERLQPMGDIRARPTRAALVGNYLHGAERAMLVDAWAAAGIECVSIGVHGTPTFDLAHELADVDIVVGKGRAILDAMSCGRAAYVHDVFGSDGWVTTDTYEALEADGFAGQGIDRVPDVDRLVADLADYRPQMGVINRQLVLARHEARVHARELVALFRELLDEPSTTRADDRDLPLDELSRLVRRHWAMQGEVHAVRQLLAIEHAASRDRAVEQQSRFDATLAAQRAIDDARVAELEALLATRRVQAGVKLGRVADRLRRR